MHSLSSSSAAPPTDAAPPRDTYTIDLTSLTEVSHVVSEMEAARSYWQLLPRSLSLAVERELLRGDDDDLGAQMEWGHVAFVLSGDVRFECAMPTDSGSIGETHGRCGSLCTCEVNGCNGWCVYGFYQLAAFMRACDGGWGGYDCSERTCPSGDDPNTYGQVNEVQLFECRGAERCGNQHVTASSFHPNFEHMCGLPEKYVGTTPRRA